MPAYDLAAIRTSIYSLLTTCPTLSYVYNRRNPTIEGYPCAIFDIVQNTNEMLTNVENERTIVFRIWLIQEVGVKGMTDANAILDNVTSEVIDTFEGIGNITLGGYCDWVMPVEGAREEVSSPQGSAIWQIVDLQVRVTSFVI